MPRRPRDPDRGGEERPLSPAQDTLVDRRGAGGVQHARDALGVAPAGSPK